MKGRIPKPTSLKKLEGITRKDRINENEPEPIPSRPTCPGHLNTPAKAEWKRMVIELEALGLLTEIDRAVLAGYCEAWGEFIEISKLLKGKSPIIKTANGNIIQNPLVGQKHKAMELMHKFAIEFGMSPSSRSRIIVEPSKDDDPMEELLRESRNN